VFESQEMKGILAGAVNRLGEREKIVITLDYYEGLTLAEIGQVPGVTESRVCQMHTKAVLQLRARCRTPASSDRGVSLRWWSTSSTTAPSWGTRVLTSGASELSTPSTDSMGVVGAAVSSPASVFLLTALALAAALFTSYTSRRGNR
jgi:hypothetical protein